MYATRMAPVDALRDRTGDLAQLAEASVAPFHEPSGTDL
jgi:hypothetical protein